jgi:hypothetical protein
MFHTSPAHLGGGDGVVSGTPHIFVGQPTQVSVTPTRGGHQHEAKIRCHPSRREASLAQQTTLDSHLPPCPAHRRSRTP